MDQFLTLLPKIISLLDRLGIGDIIRNWLNNRRSRKPRSKCSHRIVLQQNAPFSYCCKCWKWFSTEYLLNKLK